ncbi:hypothetical protein [Haladaptatus sp. T7]|uniref:hypothetical protein n=1 Tax=Haladaptatus sp. T7 TaxID=2029368 RepID=UPI0021A252A0|nr:hypothetical protein [Haladaptatus sp. T7]GKZ15179.1 hypothetical protein HAL_30600 [Haladaptatus sp. T7]
MDEDQLLETTDEDRLRELIRDELTSIEDEREESGPSLSRRGTLATLGVAGASAMGLLGSAGTATAATSEDVGTANNPVSNVYTQNLFTPQLNDGVFVVGEGGYDTIQEAHDALPAKGGGVVLVTETYDRTNESYPIHWTTRAGLVGDGVTKLGDASNDSDFILNVDFTEDRNGDGKIDDPNEAAYISHRPPGAWFENLQIEGGKVGAYIRSTRFSVWKNVNITGAYNNGFRISYDGSNAINSHAFFGCTSEKNGYDGWSVSQTAHDIKWYGCTAQLNGRHGLNVDKAFACAWVGGAIQNNGKWGVRATSAHGLTIRDAYIEANCSQDTIDDAELNPHSLSAEPPESQSDILVDDGGERAVSSAQVNIADCYINSDMSNNTYSMIINGGKCCTFRDNIVRSGSDMNCMVSIWEGVDNDVYEPSNYDDLEDVETITSSEDNGTRTRSFGVIGAATGGVNLANETGNTPGDFGLDNGTNTNGNPYYAVWDGSNWICAASPTIIA